MTTFIYSAPSQEENDAQLGLRTYSNYVQAWASCIQPSSASTATQNELASVKKLQGGISFKNGKGHYMRGSLTLTAMRSLPVEKNPELSKSANFWLPVQAYYAVHGFGLALMSSLNIKLPENHRAFCSLMGTNVLSQLFPFPFNVSCGGYALGAENQWSLKNLNCTNNDVSQVSTLASIRDENCQSLIGKSLLTSRKNLLTDSFDEERTRGVAKGKKRRNIMPDRKQEIASKLHPTTFVDFLYRMRIRSNYDDPNIFVYGQLDTDSALRHYRNIIAMVDTFKELAGNVIRRKIGKADFDAVRITKY